MIESLGATLLSSLALVAALGFRHGFDADHIAVVDGMTRARQLHKSYWTSRLVGAQFAVGHSATILVASLLLHGQSAILPQWLDGLGLVISTCFLLAIAASNFAHAWRPAGAHRPHGPMSALLLRVTGGQVHPALVGMAFALSFDSLAQAAFFASRSDRLARQASRFSSGFIAVIALLTAGAGLVRQFESGFAATWESMGIWTGVGLVTLTSVVYSVRISLQKVRSHAAAAGR
jgi:high-affinity nickel permease